MHIREISSVARAIVALLLISTLASDVARASAPAEASAKKPPVPMVVPPDINGFKMIIAPPQDPAPVRVAIFDGEGAPDGGIESVSARVRSMPGSSVTRLGPETLAGKGLDGFDVIVFSGGSGSKQARSLGDAGRERVREFVRGGGGYVGICAGAYLACSGFSWGLGILNAATVSGKWMRGSGFVDVEVTFDGAPILGPVDGIFKVRYNNGPILKPGDRADLPAYRPLALFRSEVAKNGAPAGVMVNSPAQAAGSFGRGRVFVSSPHPENTPGLEHLIPRALLWAACKPGTRAGATSP